MRGREVSVELQLDTGECLPEVSYNGTRYVVAQAGKTFQIVVKPLKVSPNTMRVPFSAPLCGCGPALNQASCRCRYASRWTVST
jgi:hypothetical protein